MTLSPFEVDASNDIGYYAENTLAGSRLNTNVGDLAASITVVTKQQLEDTGALDINDVFLYEANTEGAGTYTPQYLVAHGAADVLAGYSTNQNVGIGIAEANRVRGLGSMDTAENNYPTLARVPFDTYNANSVEINRGPNALLFGAASPSGVVNQSTAEASLNRSHTTVSVRFGSFGSHRESISTNVPIGKKFAVFLAALYDDRQFQRKPSSDVTRRQYAAATFQPFAKTRITASFENYDNYHNRPNFMEPLDAITPWLNAGKPGWDPTTQMITFANGTTKGPYLASPLDPRYVPGLTTNGMGALSSTTSPGYVPGIGSAALHYIRVNNGEIVDFFASSATEGAGVRGSPAVPTATARTVAQWMLAGNSLTESRNAEFPIPPTSTGATGYAIYYQTAITDQSLYDWTKYNFAGASYGTMANKSYKLELNQEIVRGLNLQLGWFRQELEEWTHYDVGEGNDVPNILVDTNVKNMDGTPNPFFGSPYGRGTRTDTFSNPETNDNLRATIAYEHDFSRGNGLTRFLGRARLMALATRQRDVIIRGRWRFTRDGGDPRFLIDQNPAIPNNYLFANSKDMQRNYYMGTGSDGVVSQGVKVLGEAGFGGPDRTTFRYYDWGTQAWQNTQVSMHPNLFIAGSGQGRTSKTLDSTSFAYQGNLWNNRIVPTLGTRYDKVIVYEAALAGGPTPAMPLWSYTTNGFSDPAALKIMNPTPFIISGRTNTTGVVVRPFSEWKSIDARAAQGNAFSSFLSGLSFHYNHSDNFQPPRTIESDFFGAALPRPSGTGDDYGIGGTMFNNKLIWRLNLYKATAENAVSEAANLAVTRTQRIDTTSFFSWATTVVRIRNGQDPTAQFFGDNTVTPLTDAQQAEVNALVAGPQVDATGNPVVAAYSTGNSRQWPHSTIRATNSQESKGMELSLIYNPMPNWNIKLTGGQQQSSYKNASGELEEWLYGSGDAASGDGRLNFWQNVVAPDLPTIYTQFGGKKLYLGDYWNSYGYSGDANSNTTGPISTPKSTYTSIVDARLYELFGLEGKRSPNQREYSASLITNYAFQEGRLRGLAIGGAVRWASRAVSGYYGNLDPATFAHPSATESLIAYPDLARPLYVPELFNVDVWASYSTRFPILGKDVRTKFQLNIKSLNEGGGLTPVLFNPDGVAAQYRIMDPRTYFFTTTFDF